MLTEAIIQTSTPTSLKIGGIGEDEILILESISGLSDVKVNQYIGDFAREGSYYQGRRAERRNPVFNFRLRPNYELEIDANQIREMIFRMFMEPQRDSDGVQIMLVDDKLPDRYIIGYTETIQADIFSAEMKAQCALQTVDSYLRSALETSVVNANGWFNIPVRYDGSADTGIKMAGVVLQNTSQIQVANGTEVMKLDGPFVPGDVFEIRTVPGDLAVVVNNEDHMVALTPDSPWLMLKERDNALRVYGQTPGDGAAVLTSYSYRSAWWGI